MEALKGKHVLVTGSAGGIGLDVARKYLQLDCKVSLHYNRQCDTLRDLLESYPETTIAVQGEATDENSVISAVQNAVTRFGPIHILIANHGVWPTEDVMIADMSLDRWKKTLDINLTGIFLFTREFLRHLRTHVETLSTDDKKKLDASVVIIGSTAGKWGEADHADYASSKSALMIGFMRSLKNEIVRIAPRGRVNCVAPGWVLTPMAEEAVAKGDHFKALQTTPLAKIASTEDVANAVIFLSNGVVSGHCSGTTIEVDGGMEGRVLNSLDHLRNM
eukprot:TRINITY_DN2803_c0_g1_i1.p1 TRINITY_DN2803_c0_g1~~TRINITY_DN2803_c0_g1_i1.p1  ORF type:complete len:276 (+),score=49.56 TRINITY_DN2803_c0_g1_i1:114-941(+)